ncbi:hypothetical protein [Marilutibacter spongiae]|uniref:Uncharacterized protein n=1 Tax=Marilutibacter spongiae TaxID=2025720 RepID=A0A7W3Y7G6_9GAMM|nr:hypothetical protein [Lysobacter spongiae]MBB1062174.1 hypothetical protein [Lysobacter spongiae]
MGILILAFAVSACAHSTVKPLIDTRPAVNVQELEGRFRFPKCVVSVPLTQDQAIASAGSVGAPRINERQEWRELTEKIAPGDELRHVWCMPRRGRGGVDLVGLFRGKHLLAEVHTVFVD